MATTVAINPTLNPTILDIPEPPAEFGQDGGKFYRCYDTLAGEIDEDMTQGLKEHLDGLLIFGGLFASVNSAFLALTLPMMKANPADDSNALMAQSNAILIQIALGRNDSIPTLARLPSNTFKPSRDVFAVNILFSLSLASALVSSFLAVLGRQWLVYYRKRSGGGPDRQRWEQLKRFIGAERWRLELILDDFLPSILQIGLVVFCISFGIYLHMLNPTLSYIVGIPMYVGLVFFVSSALCTLWDQFCPFQSPLSHLLSLALPLAFQALSKTIRFLLRILQHVIEDLWSHLKPTSSNSTFSLEVDFDPGPGAMVMNAVVPLSAIPQPSIIKGGSRKDDIGVLQLTALRRAVCTSDDPATLLYAAANTLAIWDRSQLESLWGDIAFRERFLELCGSSYARLSQLRGSEHLDKAISACRLYRSVAIHILLSAPLADEESRAIIDELRRPEDIREGVIWIPEDALLDSSRILIQTSLASSILSTFNQFSFSQDVVKFCKHLTAYSDALNSPSPNWGLLPLFSWIITQLQGFNHLFYDYIVGPQRINLMRQAYLGDTKMALSAINQAFTDLADHKYANLLDCNRVLHNMLQCAGHIVSSEEIHHTLHITERMQLLEIIEKVVRSPKPPGEVKQTGRKLRTDMVTTLLRSVRPRVFPGQAQTLDHLVDPLISYFVALQKMDQSEYTYHEDMESLELFYPLVWRTMIYLKNRLSPITPGDGGAPSDEELSDYNALGKAFNCFVSHVTTVHRQIQRGSKFGRDPDMLCCHRVGERVFTAAAYSLP